MSHLSVVLDIKGITALCRLCMKYHENCHNIFVSNKEFEVTIEEAIRNLLHLKVFMGDGLPSTVCNQCVSKLMEFRDFRDRCWKSDTELRIYISGNDFKLQVKEEGDALKSTSGATGDPLQVLEVVIKEEPVECEVTIATEGRDEGHDHVVPSGAEETHLHVPMLEKIATERKVDCIIKSEGDPKTLISKWRSLKAERQKVTKRVKVHSDHSYSCVCDENPSTKNLKSPRLPVITQGRKVLGKKITDAKPMSLSGIKEQNIVKVEFGNSKSSDGKEAKSEFTTYSCNHCQKRYPDKISLGLHMIVHSPVETSSRTNDSDLLSEKPLADDEKKKAVCQCEICGKSFSKKHLLRRHVLRHNSDKPFKCNICNRGFCWNSELKKHLNLHNGIKPYQCDVCGKTFTLKHHLRAHVTTHTGVKPFKCEICDKRFSISQSLKAHMITHTDLKPYKCDVCGKTSNNSGNLRKHMILHTDLRPYECNFCEKKFRSSSTLNQHRVTHSNVKPFMCDECGRAFSLRQHLQAHKRIHTGVKPYMCELCGKSYLNMNGLKTHAITHTGLKPHKCEVCGNAYNNISNLKKHIVIHTGVRPFACKFCGRKFTDKGNCNKHMATHTNSRPYKCGVCGKDFLQRGQLRNHYNASVTCQEMLEDTELLSNAILHLQEFEVNHL